VHLPTQNFLLPDISCCAKFLTRGLMMRVQNCHPHRESFPRARAFHAAQTSRSKTDAALGQSFPWQTKTHPNTVYISLVPPFLISYFNMSNLINTEKKIMNTEPCRTPLTRRRVVKFNCRHGNGRKSRRAALCDAQGLPARLLQ
jgi:hypothetical protein